MNKEYVEESFDEALNNIYTRLKIIYVLLATGFFILGIQTGILLAGIL